MVKTGSPFSNAPRVSNVFQHLPARGTTMSHSPPAPAGDCSHGTMEGLPWACVDAQILPLRDILELFRRMHGGQGWPRGPFPNLRQSSFFLVPNNIESSKRIDQGKWGANCRCEKRKLWHPWILWYANRRQRTQYEKKFMGLTLIEREPTL